MRELLIFQERDGAVGSWGVWECVSACVCCTLVRVSVCASSLNKRQFFQRGEQRMERRRGAKGVRGGKQLAPARLCSYLIGMNNKRSLGAAVRRLKRGR